jgi:hypothetical protein
MQQETIKHIDADRLEAYAMNTMAQEEIPIVEEHLLFCASCLDQLEAIEKYDRAIQGAAKRIREEEIKAPATAGIWDLVRDWFHTPAPMWAGALAAACLILVVGLQLREKPGAPVDVTLEAVRGSVTGTAPAGHALHLRLDSKGVPDSSGWRIEIVDEDGSRVWTGAGVASDTAITASVDKSFRPGIYFVRLLLEGNDPVREYQLTVKKAGP